MAASGERRMVFDIRGRRKHVVRVVYAILALLMGASLFLVVGPVNLGGLFGGSTNSGSPAAIYEERAENIERKLGRNTDDEALLLALARARIGAGNANFETDPTTGQPVITAEAKSQFERGGEAWQRYLKQVKGNPNPTVALFVAKAYLAMAESSSEYGELFENLDEAAAAEKVVTISEPNVNSLTTLATFEFLAGNFATAEKAIKKAESLATSKSDKKAIAHLAKEKRKVGKEFKKGAKEAAKAEKGKGKEQLQNPFGGLGAP